MIDPNDAIEFAKENMPASVEQLKDWLRIPSVSTLPEHKSDMEHAARWIADKLEDIGCSPVEIMQTAGHPIVYAERAGAGPDAPTVLVYGHYDVQPADPYELWESDPFSPQVRGENLFARGASDMKGQVLAQVLATEALAKTSGIPLNLKYMIEGEEEIGSPSLGAFIQENASLLSCDLCLNGDSSILGPETPSIVYALRGMAYFELRLRGPAADLHSGIFGGAVDNPATILCRLIGGMHDEDGKVTLPGFYDDVLPISSEEREELARLPQTDEWWRKQAGVGSLGGERGYSATERAGARPTLDVNGMLSGFTGAGSKTVLPSEAMAKVSMRLVPNQRPEKVKAGMEAYLRAKAPDSVSWELHDLAGAIPAIIDRDSDAARAAARALQAVWGKEALFNRQGGTVPVVGMIEELLDVKSLMLGFGLPDDNLHAPNEKLYLPNYSRGIESFIHFMIELAG